MTKKKQIFNFDSPPDCNVGHLLIVGRSVTLHATHLIPVEAHDEPGLCGKRAATQNGDRTKQQHLPTCMQSLG